MNIETLKNCVQKIDKIPISEDHLKFILATIIKDEFKSAEIYLEYPVPLSILKNYSQIMKVKDLNSIYIDIVVHIENKYYPIEIKYKTKKTNTNLNVFGKNVNFDLKQQDASTLAKYYFWKDIFRLQELKKNATIEKGFQLFLTNDESYLKKSKKNTQFRLFSIDKDRKEVEDKELFWFDGIERVDDVFDIKHKSKTFYKHPGFNIKNKTIINWEKIINIKFDYLLVEV